MSGAGSMPGGKAPGPRTDWADKASVYYGDVSRHEFLERTTWHSGQHSRQLMWVLEDKFQIAPDRPIPAGHLGGLPMPEKVWDDEKPAARNSAYRFV